MNASATVDTIAQYANGILYAYRTKYANGESVFLIAQHASDPRQTTSFSDDELSEIVAILEKDRAIKRWDVDGTPVELNTQNRVYVRKSAIKKMVHAYGMTYIRPAFRLFGDAPIIVCYDDYI